VNGSDAHATPQLGMWEPPRKATTRDKIRRVRGRKRALPRLGLTVVTLFGWTPRGEALSGQRGRGKKDELPTQLLNIQQMGRSHQLKITLDGDNGQSAVKKNKSGPG